MSGLMLDRRFPPLCSAFVLAKEAPSPSLLTSLPRSKSFSYATFDVDMDTHISVAIKAAECGSVQRMSMHACIEKPCEAVDGLHDGGSSGWASSSELDEEGDDGMSAVSSMVSSVTKPTLPRLLSQILTNTTDAPRTPSTSDMVSPPCLDDNDTLSDATRQAISSATNNSSDEVSSGAFAYAHSALEHFRARRSRIASRKQAAIAFGGEPQIETKTYVEGRCEVLESIETLSMYESCASRGCSESSDDGGEGMSVTWFPPLSDQALLSETTIDNFEHSSSTSPLPRLLGSAQSLCTSPTCAQEVGGVSDAICEPKLLDQSDLIGKPSHVALACAQSARDYFLSRQKKIAGRKHVGVP